MESRADQRASPDALWPEVRSVIMLGMSYAPANDPMALAGHPDRARISVYAQGRDYHDVVKGALKRLAGWLAHEAGADVKVFVDTAPVMEKALAEAAGIGWQGKHSNVVSRTHGSWLFLGAIYTTAELEPDLAGKDRCGSCRACQDICPTDAFPAPYQVDARRCISYLTIEHNGPIDAANCDRSSATIFMAATIALPSVRGTNLRQAPPPTRRSCRGPNWSRRVWPICSGWTMPLFVGCFQVRQSSESVAIGSSVMWRLPQGIVETRRYNLIWLLCSTIRTKWFAMRCSGPSMSLAANAAVAHPHRRHDRPQRHRSAVHRHE